jgi:proliferating cell nuclear antigen PCNA
MKEGRIVEYMLEHTNTGIFRNLFEVLGQVLHELRLIHIKPEKPVKNDRESDDEDNEEENLDSDSSDNSDSESTTKGKKKIIKDNKKTKKDSIKDSKQETKREEGGIKILEVNDHNTIIVHVRLLAKNFYTFDCKYDQYIVGIEPQTMFNFIKNIDKEGLMSVYINENTKNLINIELNNIEKKNKATYEFKLMDLDENKQKIPGPQFDVIIEMKTDDFHNMCKEMATHGKYMAITCTEKKLEFKCKGNSGVIKKEFENGGSVTITLKNEGPKKNEPKIISEIYDLHNITMFTKCRSLCSNIQLLLQNKKPLFIRYEVATLGVMQIGFVPVNEDSLSRNINYDQKLDQYYPESNVTMKSL